MRAVLYSVSLLVASTAWRQAWAEPVLSDFQTWSSWKVTSQVGEHLEASGEGLLALTDDSSRLGQLLLRGILAYRLNDHFAVGGGYTYFRIDDGIGSRYDEHRLLQDLYFRTPHQESRAVISLRTRLEERVRVGQDGVSFRLRQLTRVDLPI